MPIKRHPTLSKGVKKTVTPDTIRKNFAKGAKKRAAKKLIEERVMARKSRAANEADQRKPRG